MMGIKKLDWYIFRKFILTFFMAILFIIVVVIIFDISEKIDDFVSKEAPLKEIIFTYYLNFIPYFMNMFSPLFVFITVIFITSRMAANSEFIAMLSCGISYRRILIPYLASALLIATISLGLNLFVIPKSTALRLNFDKKYITHRRSATNSYKNIHYQIDTGKFVYVESFSEWNNTAYNFTLEQIKDNELVSKLSAEKAVWDEEKGLWHLKKYFIRNYVERGIEDDITTGQQIDTVISLSKDDFFRNKYTIETLDYFDLNDLIDVQIMRGDANVMYAQIEKHRRIALPFSAFILTIMGVALASRKKRGGTGWNMGIGIGLSFSYILFIRFSEMFVFTGTLPPYLALWVPNLIFSLIAYFIYSRAQK